MHWYWWFHSFVPRFICDNLALPVPCHWERVNTDEPYQVSNLHLHLHSFNCLPDLLFDFFFRFCPTAHSSVQRHIWVQRSGQVVWKNHVSTYKIHSEDTEPGSMGVFLQVYTSVCLCHSHTCSDYIQWENILDFSNSLAEMMTYKQSCDSIIQLLTHYWKARSTLVNIFSILTPLLMVE